MVPVSYLLQIVSLIDDIGDIECVMIKYTRRGHHQRPRRDRPARLAMWRLLRPAVSESPNAYWLSFVKFIKICGR
jgi:hypothetical protein